MRICKFRKRGVIRSGIVTGSKVQPIHESIEELIEGSTPTSWGDKLDLDEVQLLAPLSADCRGLICAGINYVDHQQETADAFVSTVPEHPIIFFKTLSAVADPGEVLALEAGVSEQFDWEAELGVVIGKPGRDIHPDDVPDHVFGYTVVNDITARDVQHRHRQWYLGKNVDRSTPVGPWIVSSDEFDDVPGLDLRLEVNGVLKQQANTRDMVFSVAEQVALVSRHVRLLPGDVLATGTPAGVGFARHPPEFLREGDVVVASIERIGALQNRVSTVSNRPDPAMAVNL